MNKGKLRFIGRGSAFNTELGCNSGYIVKNKSLVLFDCGGDVFGRLKHMRVLTDDIESIIVFETHLHPDHVASLGDLIYYSHFIAKLREKIRIVSIDAGLVTLLSLMGVRQEFYNIHLIEANKKDLIFDSEFGEIVCEAVKNKHYPDMESCGYIVNVDNTTLYYSGDSCEIPERALEGFLCGNIEELYQDTCGLEYEGNPHFPIRKLAELIPQEYRNRVFCMHIDESLYANEYKIHEYGFNLILNDYEIKAIEYKTKTAVYAGSFDPMTEGHKEMIVKSSKMFDKVVVGVLINNKKTPLFSMEERVEHIRRCTAGLPNVEVKMFKGLLVDFAVENNAQVIIRGLRSVSDFENEIQIAMTNKQLNADIETSLLVPDIKHQYISSSMVKELASMKADISWIVPAEILDEVKAKFRYDSEKYSLTKELSE